jgi:hypothetical protein
MNGVDAVSSHETGMDTKDDDAQMQFAVSQGRAIVTINKRDFARINARYKAGSREHYGVIVSNDIDHSVIYRRLLKLTANLQAENIKNRLIKLHDFRR